MDPHIFTATAVRATVSAGDISTALVTSLMTLVLGALTWVVMEVVRISANA